MDTFDQKWNISLSWTDEKQNQKLFLNQSGDKEQKNRDISNRNHMKNRNDWSNLSGSFTFSNVEYQKRSLNKTKQVNEGKHD